MEKDNKTMQDESCCICLSELESQRHASLSCNHNFHFDCLAKWLKVHPSCPLCKQQTKAFQHKSKTIKLFQEDSDLDKNILYLDEISICSICKDYCGLEETDDYVYCINECDDICHISCIPEDLLNDRNEYLCKDCTKLLGKQKVKRVSKFLKLNKGTIQSQSNKKVSNPFDEDDEDDDDDDDDESESLNSSEDESESDDSEEEDRMESSGSRHTTNNPQIQQKKRKRKKRNIIMKDRNRFEDRMMRYYNNHSQTLSSSSASIPTHNTAASTSVHTGSVPSVRTITDTLKNKTTAKLKSMKGKRAPSIPIIESTNSSTTSSANLIKKKSGPSKLIQEIKRELSHHPSSGNHLQKRKKSSTAILYPMSSSSFISSSSSHPSNSSSQARSGSYQHPRLPGPRDDRIDLLKNILLSS